MLPRRFAPPALAVLTAMALVVGACKGKDLNALKAQALGLVDKYKPQIQSGLTTVEALLTKTKALPAETQGVAGYVAKLNDQTGALTKLKALVEAAPAAVDQAVKAGDTDGLEKVKASLDGEVASGLKASDTVLADVQKNVDGLVADYRVTEVKKAAGSLDSRLAPGLAAALAKVDEVEAKVKALPPETAGLADFQKTLEVQRTAGTQARAKLDGVVAQVDAALTGKDIAGAERLVESVGQDVADITKKMEVDTLELQKKVAALANPAPAADAAAFDKALATGFEVKGQATGVESGLIAFLDDAARPVDKTTWFDFDRLTFASGSVALDMEKSKDQLTNIVEILKAYPAAKLKIGGYTDNDGPAAANKKISQQRADAVVKALVDLGVAGDRLEAEGYGPEFPVCPANDTPECKAKNRRIAVRVSAK